MSTMDIKGDMTSETMKNFPFCHFDVEALYATSLTLVTVCRADKLLSALELIYRTSWQDNDFEDSALSNT